MTTLKQRVGQFLIPRLPVNRRTFDILRFELNAAVVQTLARVDPRTRRVIRRLAQQRGLLVNIGSGAESPMGWIGIDIRASAPGQLRWDIRKGLPFAEQSVALVYASHVIEHLDYRQDVPRLLAAVFQALERGGRIRVVVPDAARYLEAYVSSDPVKWAALGLPHLPEDMPTAMCMVNHVFHQGGEHQFGYDFETLVAVLKRAGFKYVERSSFRSSYCFEHALDLAVHEPYSLYVEAAKS